MNNWIHNTGEVSMKDKIKELTMSGYKLVLVQFHEIERLRTKMHYKDEEYQYVNRLYKHYIIDCLGKTYLQQN
jgi:hypothetical protein